MSDDTMDVTIVELESTVEWPGVGGLSEREINVSWAPSGFPRSAVIRLEDPLANLVLLQRLAEGIGRRVRLRHADDDKESVVATLKAVDVVRGEIWIVGGEVE